MIECGPGVDCGVWSQTRDVSSIRLCVVRTCYSLRVILLPGAYLPKLVPVDGPTRSHLAPRADPFDRVEYLLNRIALAPSGRQLGRLSTTPSCGERRPGRDHQSNSVTCARTAATDLQESQRSWERASNGSESAGAGAAGGS